MAIRLFQSETSMFCEKVRIVLAMKDVPYEIVDVKKDDRKSLIQYSGQRKVPVMDFNGQRIIDSTYIAAHLEERYPRNSIYPSGVADRGLCLMLEDWADEVLNHALHLMRRAEGPEARKAGEKELGVHLGSLDQFLTGKQCIFDRVTIADLAIFTQLHYLYTVIKYEIPAGYKNLNGWMEFIGQTVGLSSLYDSAA